MLKDRGNPNQQRKNVGSGGRWLEAAYGGGAKNLLF